MSGNSLRCICVASNRRTTEWYKTIEKAHLSDEQVQKLKANVKIKFQVGSKWVLSECHAPITEPRNG